VEDERNGNGTGEGEIISLQGSFLYFHSQIRLVVDGMEKYNNEK